MDIVIHIIESNDNKHDKLARILEYVVDLCKIDQQKYIIIGSYYLRNKREINDLDIIMDLEAHLGTHVADFSIEIFQKYSNEGFPNPDFSLSTLIKNNGLDIDDFGHQHFNRETLLAWKKVMNRPKDQDDIKLLAI